MNQRRNRKNIINDTIVKEILEALNDLKYGHVLITVHNSKIVQIDKTDKIRFDDTSCIEKTKIPKQTYKVSKQATAATVIN